MLSFPLHGPPMRLCMGLVCILPLWNAVSGLKGEGKKDKEMALLPAAVSGNEGLKNEKYGSFLHTAESAFREKKTVKGVDVLATTELPARSVDLSALNLTELVNGMLSRALKDSKQFFSVLSITSYSSFAFHKVSVAIYNISNPKTVDPAKFPTRYCYCLSNRTNDLSDFTALLVDIVGNSTSYLTEIFKSTSILSVSQTNESDCVFICVMVGKSGRNLSDFWEMVEKSPVINYTFTSGVSSALATTRGTVRTSRLTTQSQHSLLRSYTTRWTTQWVSALKTFPWTKTSTPSEKEVTENEQMFPELPVESIGTQSSVPTSTNMTRTPWVTRRSTQAPTVLSGSMSVPLTVDDSTPGGPPWTSLPSTSASTEDAQELSSTESQLHPTGILTTPSRLAQPSIVSGTLMPGTQTTNPTKAPAPRVPQTDDIPAEWSITPEKEPARVPATHHVSNCPRPLPKEEAITDTPLPLTMKKLNPCLMELCRFFQQCLCSVRKRDFSSEAMSSCCLPKKIRRQITHFIR
ncbi:LOW QUALITY PROTEIN: HERV-H LTR-associating protein 1 [Rattus rattus]|uniref:LOW QUALITY PROTEIN: HERV-H LTR-associating protein 1 n=1 Tax=Rattus rattus TaxID=10117 RepID=UPI0013F32B32|nr:LOW QUALITY PROTEIN: HERV-H LTR-associating protein 1 [Rattus rattus]